MANKLTDMSNKLTDTIGSSGVNVLIINTLFALACNWCKREIDI